LKISKWISIRDELPPLNEYILVWVQGVYNRAIIAFLTGYEYEKGRYIRKYRTPKAGHYSIERNNGITHWMPLPKKP
jgi:hypothetical protein